MSTIVLGCDINNSRDKDFQNTVAKMLENAGHTVEKLRIHPTPFADYSYSSKAKGKIGVYIMADSLVSVADLAFGNTNFKYAYFGIRGDLGKPRMSTIEHFKTSPIGRDADCTSICDKLAGKTYPQMNEVTKNKCQCVFGKTPKEMGNAILEAMGGETDSNNSKKTTSAPSIKESLKKICSPWDGDVEIRLINNTVHVNKIKDPTTTKLVIDEYNCLYDSVKVTDVNPDTINYLSCSYKDYDLVLSDDVLISRFGKNALVVNIPPHVKSLDEAESFLHREWNKIRRDDGRSVELKVEGSMNYRQGVWCRVYFPSYFINDYMYVSKCFHEEEGSNNWTTSLTLVDYPPSFGAEVEETEEDSN